MIRNIQIAFKKAVVEQFGPFDGEIIPRDHVIRSFEAEGAESYTIVLDGEVVGGTVLAIHPDAEQLEDQDYEAWKTATIRQEVDNLPDDEKEVIQRRYFSGDTQKDIAESLKLSPQRISQQEKRALRKLKERKILQDIACYVDRHTDYYHRVGVQPFHRNGLSAVEEIVFSRERLWKQRTKYWN